MSEWENFYVPADGMTLRVPCQGAIHRVQWVYDGPVRLLDHPCRRTRWFEKQLARAAGELDAKRYRWRSTPPTNGCLGILTALKDMAGFMDGAILPEWLWLFPDAREGFRAIVHSAIRAKREKRQKARLDRDGIAPGHLETRRLDDGSHMTISSSFAIRVQRLPDGKLRVGPKRKG